VIDLPYGVRLESFASVNQVEALAVCLVPAVSEHQQPRGEAAYDPPNHVIARLGFLKSLGHRACLSVSGTDREWRPLKREPFNSLDQL
jgi:hypothetical protein